VRLRSVVARQRLFLPDARIVATALVVLGSEAGLDLGARIRRAAGCGGAEEIGIGDSEHGALLLALGAVESDGYLTADLRALRDSLLVST